MGFINLTFYFQGISITLLDNYCCHGSQLVEWVLNPSEDVTKCQSLMDFRYVQICALISHVFEPFCAFISTHTYCECFRSLVWGSYLKDPWLTNWKSTTCTCFIAVEDRIPNLTCMEQMLHQIRVISIILIMFINKFYNSYKTYSDSWR